MMLGQRFAGVSRTHDDNRLKIGFIISRKYHLKMTIGATDCCTNDIYVLIRGHVFASEKKLVE